MKTLEINGVQYKYYNIDCESNEGYVIITLDLTDAQVGELRKYFNDYINIGGYQLGLLKELEYTGNDWRLTVKPLNKIETELKKEYEEHGIDIKEHKIMIAGSNITDLFKNGLVIGHFDDFCIDYTDYAIIGYDRDKSNGTECIFLAPWIDNGSISIGSADIY